MNIPAAVAESMSLAFWGSLIVSGLFSYPLYRLLKLMKSRQTVSEFAPASHQVKQGTPTMGGLMIVAGFTAAAVLVAQPGSSAISPSMLGLFFGFALIGFVDDFVIPRMGSGKRGLGWKQKLLVQFLVAAAAAYTHTGGELDLRWGLAVFIVLFAANAYNFLDGLDALAGSVLLALCAGLGALAMTGIVVPEPAIVAAALVGGVLPFLFFNAPPAKLFMGDVGALSIGSVLGLSLTALLAPKGQAMGTAVDSSASILDQFQASRAIEGTLWRPEMLLPVAVLCGVLIIELVPVPTQVAWFKLFRRKLFLFTPIHHAFEKKGWAETRVVWMFFLLQVIMSALAVYVAQHLEPFRPGALP